MNINKVKYFFNIAQDVSYASTCLSRQVGSILVKDGIIVSTGYNGPARGVPHCYECARKSDPNYKSGMNLDICPAVHAEANCIASAARLGTSTLDSILFINTVVPCKSCISILINAGVKEVYAFDCFYDGLSMYIVNSTDIIIHLHEKDTILKGGTITCPQ